jgi:hypothetical protein
MKLNALLVKDGEMTRVEIEKGGDSAASAIRELVGGWFSTCFHVPGAGGGRRMVTGLCDDEGQMKHLDLNVVIDNTLYRGGYPILGPIVVMAFNGEHSASMTEVEMSAFHIIKTGRGSILTFRPGYDV